MTARVLVIDDDPPTRVVLADALILAGFDVETAGNGRDALAAVSQHRPDVILLDIHMPLLDGTEFLMLVEYFLDEVPPRIVLLTADRDAAEHLRAKKRWQVLDKPFELEDLMDAVRGRRSHDN